jgi:hypothetical protein
MLRHCAFLAGIVLALPVAAANEANTTAEELRVYGALLESASTTAPKTWILVGAQTATFECDPPAPIGLDVGGCTGMRVAPETATERLNKVVRDLPQVTAEMRADLALKSQASQPLVGRIPTALTYVLASPQAPLPDTVDGNPEFALYVSRVGFSDDGTRALVYMGTMNWSDASKSMGQYVLLVKHEAEWRVTGHSLVWRL